MRDGPRIAVIGASGLVGQEVLAALGDHRVRMSALHAYATDRSAGDEVSCGEYVTRIERLPPVLPDIDVAFLCVPTEVSKDVTEDLVDEGALVIDMSGSFVDDLEVPLVGPGVVLGARPGGRVLSVAEPRSTMVAAVNQALASEFGVRRILVTFLVPASFAGRDSVARLAKESIALLGGHEGEDPEGLAFNVRLNAPAGDERVRREIDRLVGAGVTFDLRTLRVPGFHGLGASLWIETSRAPDRGDLERALRESPSLLVAQDADGSREAVGSDAIHIGSVHTSGPWVSVWITADNLRQGAALNAVAVLEALFRP